MIAKYIFLCVCVTTSIVVNAQEPELSKEITVETDFVPTEQKAVKLNVLPDVFKTTIPKKSLAYSDWSGTVEVPYSIDKYKPYGFNTKYDYSKVKGYAGLGIGSQLNMLGYAGYKFLDDNVKTLNAWLQHSSTWIGKNSSPLAMPNAKKQKNNDNVLNVNYSHKFDLGVLNLGTYYHIDNFNYYGVDNFSELQNVDHQTVNEFAIKAGWQNPMSARSKFVYSGELSYTYFGFSKGEGNVANGLKENNLTGKASVRVKLDSLSVGLNVEGNYLKYSNGMLVEPYWKGLLKVTPYFYYSGYNLHIRGGLNLEFSANDGKGVRISPDVIVEYDIIESLSVYANAKGGKQLNRMSDCFATCRYLSPTMFLHSTNVPIDAEVGVKYGVVKGMYIKPFFGYGKFNNILSPYIDKEKQEDEVGYYDAYVPSLYVTMGSNDIKGWKYGVELGYKYNELAELKCNLQYSPQDLNEGYYQGFDRAETVMNVELKVKPIKALTLTIGYDWRTGRKYYSNYGMVGQPAVHSWGETKMNAVNNLSASANYRINEMMSAFVSAGNLLNKQWDEYYGMGNQKLNVLAGVNVLF